MKNYFVLLLMFIFLNAHAEEYLGRDMASWPQTDARKVKDDFAAWLLVTPNMDWQEKWDTPPDTIPYFDEAKEVQVGDQLAVLTFFANPGIDESGHAVVRCSLKVTRPDGTLSVPKQDFDCMNGALRGEPRNIRLSPAVIQFTAEPSDVKGIWKVDVVLEDTVREVTLDLSTTYELVSQ